MGHKQNRKNDTTRMSELLGTDVVGSEETLVKLVEAEAASHETQNRRQPLLPLEPC
jgi:hypothetical protein